MQKILLKSRERKRQMSLQRIHTDLALEAKEKFEEDNVEVRGVVIEEDYNQEKDIRTRGENYGKTARCLYYH